MTRLLEAVAFPNSGLMSEIATDQLLTEEQYLEVLREIVPPIRETLVGRGTIMASTMRQTLGVTRAKQYVKSDGSGAIVSMDFEESDDLPALSPEYTLVPIIQKTFKLGRRQVATLNEDNLGLEIADIVESLGREVAEGENYMLFSGWDEDGDGTVDVEGISQAANNTVAASAAWDVTGTAWKDVEGAIDKLEEDNYRGPYNLFLTRTDKALIRKTKSTYKETREIDEVTAALDGGSIYTIPAGMGIAAGTGYLAAAPSTRWCEHRIYWDIAPEMWLDDNRNLHGRIYTAQTLLWKGTKGKNAVCSITSIAAT